MREAEAPPDNLGSFPLYAASRRAVENLQQMERAYWEKGAGLTPNWLASPLATNVATIPDQWLLAVDLAGRHPGPNQLAGGSFEDLPTDAAGWLATYGKPAPGDRHGRGPLARRAPFRQAELAAEGISASERSHAPPAILEMAPISVTTPSLPIRAGQIAWIHGWVRLAAAPGSTVDGLLITDSLGGDTLAERVGSTHGWQDAERNKQGLMPLPVKKNTAKDKNKPEKPKVPGEEPEILQEDWKEFSLYRATPQSGYLTVTFALTGLGDAWLDDVTIQFIDRDSRPMTQATAPPMKPEFPAR